MRGSFRRQVVAMGVGCLAVAGAQAPLAQAQPPAAEQFIELSTPGVSPQVLLHVERIPNRDDFMFLLVVTSSRCRFPQGLAMPMQLNDVYVDVKNVLRVGQETQTDGSCDESLATAFTPADFARMAAAERTDLMLPTGTVRLSGKVGDYLRAAMPNWAAVAPTAAITPMVSSSDLGALESAFARFVRAGQYAFAIPVADRIVALSGNGPIGARIGALVNLGAVKRGFGDLEGAERAYEQAIALGDVPDVPKDTQGVAFDNLAMIKRARRDYTGAEAASDRALTLLEHAVGPGRRDYGFALNNRAVIAHEQGKFVVAADYSDRALVVLGEVFAGDPTALAPFVDDNRQFKADLPR